jgi:hypothetical protein
VVEKAMHYALMAVPDQDATAVVVRMRGDREPG